jgi:hypothetical protein
MMREPAPSLEGPSLLVRSRRLVDVCTDDRKQTKPTQFVDPTPDRVRSATMGRYA